MVVKVNEVFRVIIAVRLQGLLGLSGYYAIRKDRADEGAGEGDGADRPNSFLS